MKTTHIALTLALFLLITACSANVTALPTTTTEAATSIPLSPTSRITMMPTWTPSATSLPTLTPTPKKTSTPLFTPVGTTSNLPTSHPSGSTVEVLNDRPTYSQVARPANLVSLQYDPSIWTLGTSYPTSHMGYSLAHASIPDCKLEPSIGKGVEGAQVEQLKVTLGTTAFQVARVSQAGVLTFSNYCTGEGEDATCYQMTPGADHSACAQAAEAVLSTFKLIANPFTSQPAASPNRWVCQDEAGTTGLCAISYSIQMDALAFTPDGQAWAAGDKGVLYDRVGQKWVQFTSPSSHTIFDLNFASSTSGWAVGDGAQVLRWDGSEWTEILPYHAPGEGPGGSTQVLYAVDVLSKTDAWMVGAMKGLDGKTLPYVLHWDGKDLIEVGDLPVCNCGLNAVLAISADNVYAAGGSDMGALIFHWDGSAWSQQLISGADHLYTLSQSVDGTIWTAGIEISRDQSETRGALFHWNGAAWQRVAVPPIPGGAYAVSALPTGQIVLGGDFSALRTGLQWQSISTDIAAFGWIVDIERDPSGNVWALTRSGNIFKLAITG